jgi:hypothetical protein
MDMKTPEFKKALQAMLATVPAYIRWSAGERGAGRIPCATDEGSPVRLFWSASPWEAKEAFSKALEDEKSRLRWAGKSPVEVAEIVRRLAAEAYRNDDGQGGSEDHFLLRGVRRAQAEGAAVSQEFLAEAEMAVEVAEAEQAAASAALMAGAAALDSISAELIALGIPVDYANRAAGLVFRGVLTRPNAKAWAKVEQDKDIALAARVAAAEVEEAEVARRYDSEPKDVQGGEWSKVD